MKYYNLKNKIFKEQCSYAYFKSKSRILGILPGIRRDYWKRHYEQTYKQKFSLSNFSNSIPDGKMLKMNRIIVSDMIRREDVVKLQAGLKKLLLKYRSNRFLDLHHDGLDEVYSKIEKMDSTLNIYYNRIDCGIFEFKNSRLSSSIDHFSLSVSNLNTSFFSLNFEICFSKKKNEELEQLIKNDYIEDRGYAKSILINKKSNSRHTGAFISHVNVNYNNDFLKADKIYEAISFVEWEFFEYLNQYFPFVLHGKSIMPPRIEIYYTDIDYHEPNLHFWDSIGIYHLGGQFIDERHKLFFDYTLSDRYDLFEPKKRLIYIVKDDGIEEGRFESVKDEVYFHMKDYSLYYFRVLFLKIMCDEAAKNTIIFKQKLDSIKLKKNHLSKLLELKYNFLLNIDDYNRYMRDFNPDQIESRLKEIFEENEILLETFSRKIPVYTYRQFVHGAKSIAENVDKSIRVLSNEFEDKKVILQNLYEYKSTKKSINLNYGMFLLAIVTLFDILFPNLGVKIGKFLIKIFKSLIDIVINCIT